MNVSTDITDKLFHTNSSPFQSLTINLEATSEMMKNSLLNINIIASLLVLGIDFHWQVYFAHKGAAPLILATKKPSVHNPQMTR